MCVSDISLRVFADRNIYKNEEMIYFIYHSHRNMMMMTPTYLHIARILIWKFELPLPD